MATGASFSRRSGFLRRSLLLLRRSTVTVVVVLLALVDFFLPVAFLEAADAFEREVVFLAADVLEVVDALEAVDALFGLVAFLLVFLVVATS